MDALPPDRKQVDLWYTWTQEAADPALLAEYRQLLPPGEAEREQRFVLERSRLEYLVTRALVRTTLSYYAAHDPRAWVFAQNAYGKPFVQEPPGTGLTFNLTHSAGLIVCAVARGLEVGVDTEALTRSPDCLSLARRYFARSEAAAIHRTAPDKRGEAFIQFWTLKEALIKACGRGLSMPLDSFAFTLLPGEPPAVSFVPESREDPGRWQFAQMRLGPKHQVALAVRSSVAGPLALRACQTVPCRLRGEPRPISTARGWEAS